MKKNNLKTNDLRSGFTLFLAVVITGTLFLIATGVTSLALKQSRISSSGRDSQIAFYAADSGLECALYWDIRNPGGDQSAFATTTSTQINCNRDANNPSNQWVVGGGYTSGFTMTFLPDQFCAKVTVIKQTNGATSVESLGYNTCDSNNPRRVERAVRASY